MLKTRSMNSNVFLKNHSLVVAFANNTGSYIFHLVGSLSLSGFKHLEYNFLRCFASGVQQRTFL